LKVTPAAAASLITRQLRGMFVWSGILSVPSNVIGLYASYYLRVSSGGAIILSCSSLFGAVFIGTQLWRLPRFAVNAQ